MDYRESPTVWYKGDDRYPPQFGKKICIDWSKNKIRMSLILYPKNNHPNIKKEIQTYVEWFDLGHILLDFFYFENIIEE